MWVENEDELDEQKLIEDLAKAGDGENEGGEMGEEERSERTATQREMDPLHQLITLFHQSALTERIRLAEDNLYLAYTDIMAKSCQAEDEDEDGHDEVKTFEEKELEKQRLLYQQARLHHRGASEMVLQRLSAGRGVMGPSVEATLKLGIAILNGGNSDVQQESISDFYWYYSGKKVIDEPGQRNFSKAIRVAKQVFNTLTEYIQGPCTGNQQSLAHSRLWDAVVGFLHVFAHMQMKLSQDSSQIELLKELMDLLKDMVVMLLSMLEGNVVNGTIGKQMVDMLVESSNNVEMILTFFDMFLKLKDLVSSDSFKEYDPVGQGLISEKDFQKAMEGYKRYTVSEMEFLLSCTETDESKLLDYRAFVARFHEPAKDIGFNVAVLLTNLSEHMPHDARLKNFLELADSVLRYFQPHLGRIEIMGSGKRVERVYFEISESSRTQWEKPQVKESKRQFIFDIVNKGGEKEKTELFVNFCEDTIFEMQLAAQISASDRDEEVLETEDDRVDKKKDEDKNPTEENLGGKKGLSLIEMMKQLVLAPICGLMMIICLLSIWNLKRQTKRMSIKSLVLAIILLFQKVLSAIFRTIVGTACFILHVLYLVFLSGCVIEFAKETKLSDFFRNLPDPTSDDVTGVYEAVTHKVRGPKLTGPSRSDVQAMSLDLSTVSRNPQLLTDIFGLQLRKEGGQYMLLSQDSNTIVSEVMNRSKYQAAVSEEEVEEEDEEKYSESEKAEGEDNEKKSQRQEDEVKRRFRRMSSHKAVEPEVQESAMWKIINSQKTKLLNYFARNFYNMRVLALCVSFSINFILLFYKVPLVVFKREKELARKLEFDGLYVTQQPADDDIRGQWDRLAINTPSFPSNYWDKFVKRKVMAKYSELYGTERISELLGLDKTTLDFSYEARKGRRPARELYFKYFVDSYVFKGSLIIDAFGELRDQQEQVKEDMETKCFICGIGSEYFDGVPHGFESHTLHEHNLANYLFFVQYLINKDVTEHTGQESYVWKMYQERCWEFFPVGDCFRKQYEDQLG
ncbi:Ryanodine receptor 2 [Bagarius yarrelli]|uniref:Ryanodine receptor 2 n=1 Tax=Bagarius yarrelli TaxID=175774 RepID=A0A556V2Y2_BAGYA|nr:Ryanodine receptor 2 [Bagarius yarrelli]